MTAFLFDIGNVIIKFDFRIAISKVIQHCSTSPEEVLPRLQPLTDRFECGEFSTPEFVALASEAIGYSGSPADFVAAFEDIFELNEPIADLISELSELDHPLFLLSNTNAIHVPFFENKWPEVFGKFDGGVYSHEAGMMKPDPAIFSHTIETLNLTPGNTIYIDDRADNCEAGSTAGLQTHRYDYSNHDELTRFIRQTNSVSL